MSVGIQQGPFGLNKVRLPVECANPLLRLPENFEYREPAVPVPIGFRGLEHIGQNAREFRLVVTLVRTRGGNQDTTRAGKMRKKFSGRRGGREKHHAGLARGPPQSPADFPCPDIRSRDVEVHVAVGRIRMPQKENPHRPLVGGSGIIVGRKGNVGTVYWSDCPFFPIDTVFYVSSEESSLFVFAMLSAQSFVSSDAAVPGLNRNYAYSKKVLVPGRAIVDEFNDIAHTSWTQLEHLRSQNAKLRSARDLLLPRLMDGRIPV